MWGYDAFCCGFGWWWVFPAVMILMMFLCFFMMRRRGWMMCGPSPRMSDDSCWGRHSETAREILDKRYARGEIEKEEYEEKKKELG